MTRSLPELNRNSSRKNCKDELVKLIEIHREIRRRREKAEAVWL
jgi:hypothetical protein